MCKSVKAGITYVVAAGNFNIDAAGYVPAGFSEVITVSAWSDTDGAAGGAGGTHTCTGGWGLQTDDTWATGTNWGTVVDIAAPGVGIKSTWKNGGYNTICGTSMSSPHVAGAAALLLKTNPAWTPAQVKSALLAADTALANTPKHIGEPAQRQHLLTRMLGRARSQDDDVGDGARRWRHVNSATASQCSSVLAETPAAQEPALSTAAST